MNQISQFLRKFKDKINEKAKALNDAAIALQRAEDTEMTRDISSVPPQSEDDRQSEQSEQSGRSGNSGQSQQSMQPEQKSKNYIHKITARVSQSARTERADMSRSSSGDPVDQPPAHISNHGLDKNKNQNTDHRRIFLDYASLTPIDQRVKKVMIEAMEEYSANPSSLYREGIRAKKALHDARTSIAQFFSIQPDEIIFTSGGTESNNLAFQGVLSHCEQMIREGGSEKRTKNTRPHFIISTIEHPSIVEIALDLIQRGYEVSFVPVNSEGLVDPRDIKKALRPETILVSIMYANNEIGTIQPIKEIAREIRHYKKSIGRGISEYPYMHTDACQAALYEDMRVPTLGIDLLSIDGGKVYGPRGTGVLVRRRHIALAPLFFGGSQEAGFRAGTENLPSIIGLKHALDIAHSEREEASAKAKQFTETFHDLLCARLSGVLPEISLNGDMERRLPNNINICFPGLDAEFLVLRLDALGVALSSVTSCRANHEDSSSYVVEALNKKISVPDRMGKKKDDKDDGGNIDSNASDSSCSRSSLRITVGRFTTSEDIAIAIEKIVQAVQEQLEQK